MTMTEVFHARRRHVNRVQWSDLDRIQTMAAIVEYPVRQQVFTGTAGLAERTQR